MKRGLWLVLLVACRSHGETHGESKRNVANEAPEVPTLDMPTTASATPASSGPTPAEAIARVMRANMRPMKACYERALAKNPSLSGRVAMRLSIDEKGKVVSAEADPAGTTLKDASVSSCLATETKKIQFPESTAPTTVTWPFNFTS